MFLGELNDLKLLEMLRWHHVGMGYLGQLVIVVDLNGCLLIPDGIDPRLRTRGDSPDGTQRYQLPCIHS